MSSTATTDAPVDQIAVGTIQHVQPQQLLLMRNIRETKLDPEFVASIKELGVLEPIVAVLNDEGALVVRFGHRRTMAAVEAGLGSVPVYVAGSDDVNDSAEIDRIIRQHDENTRRTGLTAGEEVNVVEQLAAFGLSPAQIVKRKRIPRSQVDAALAVSQSKAASEAAAAAPDMTLEQAAVLAEFDDDPDVVELLTRTAADDPAKFEHQVQQQRDERTDRAARAELISSLEKHGVRYVEDLDWRKGLYYLKASEGGAQLTKANHAKCPGHVGTIDHRGWTKENRPKYEISYGCDDPVGNGHYSTLSTPSTRTPAAQKSDAEREKDKKARALVIANNKAWNSATTVRRDWLKSFAASKSAPKGAAAFVAFALDRDSYKLQDITGHDLAGEWLGVDPRKVGEAATAATDARALQIALVQVLAVFEAHALDNMTWRRNGKTEWHGRYLRFLEECGYNLSEVEQYAVSTKTA